MAGHYPPNCYPAAGDVPDLGYPFTEPFNQLSVNGLTVSGNGVPFPTKVPFPWLPAMRV